MHYCPLSFVIVPSYTTNCLLLLFFCFKLIGIIFALYRVVWSDLRLVDVKERILALQVSFKHFYLTDLRIGSNQFVVLSQ